MIEVIKNPHIADGASGTDSTLMRGNTAARPSTAFESAVAETALSFVGAPAINHKSQAGCNFGGTHDRCVEVGLGPGGYDCSGFIAAVLSRVMRRSTEDWPAEMRHVRQMHARTEAGVGSLAAGTLLVFGRYYEIAGEDTLVPAHVGIVSSVTDEATTIVHALDAQRAVVREPLTTELFENVLGVIRPAHLVAA